MKVQNMNNKKWSIRVTKKAKPGKSNRTTPCPPRLVKLLEEVNCIPPDFYPMTLIRENSTAGKQKLKPFWKYLKSNVPKAEFPLFHKLIAWRGLAKAAQEVFDDKCQNVENEGKEDLLDLDVSVYERALLTLKCPKSLNFSEQEKAEIFLVTIVEYIENCRGYLRNLAFARELSKRLSSVTYQYNSDDCEAIIEAHIDQVLDPCAKPNREYDAEVARWTFNDSMLVTPIMDDEYEEKVNFILPSPILFWDVNHKIRFLESPLYKALDGVDIDRIRVCPICKKIYWAGRIDQPTCSKKCGALLRVRRWRVAYPDKYKSQRYFRLERKSEAK
jgi:hypothetical protein